jgi:hypothetical protein
MKQKIEEGFNEATKTLLDAAESGNAREVLSQLIQEGVDINAVDEDDRHLHAWQFCHRNRQKLEKDTICGCFYCLTIFPPKEIDEWCDAGNTALCPYCGIDSIIGKSSGHPITVEFLQRMKKYWFRSR